MSVPLSATGRIVLTYADAGLSHKVHYFCRGITAVGGTFNINTYSVDANDLAWHDAVTATASYVNLMLSANRTWEPARLEKFVSGVWQLVDVYSFSSTAGGGTLQPATQQTYTFLDKQYHKVKIVLLDTIKTAPQHFATPTGGDANFDTFIAAHIPGSAGAGDPGNWMVSRGNQYLASSPFIACTVTLNRRVRRRRGLT